MAFLDSSGVTRLWQHIIAKLGNKVDKETGKGLSTNDYTTTEKNKLAGIAEGANNYTLPVASSTLGGVRTTNTDELEVLTAQGYAPIPIVNGIPYFMPVSVSENSGFPSLTVGNLDLNLPIAMNVGSNTKPVYFLDGYPYETTYTLEASVPANAKFTDTTYTAGNSGIAISAQKIYNKGILSLSQGTTNGTIKYTWFNQQVNNVVESDLKIKGLDTAAYHPESYFVPATRTINNKALSANISLTASDVGAAASSHTHSYLPLSGGTVTGNLGVNGTITAKTYLAVERNSNPQLALKNANSNPLAVLYTVTSDGSYGNTHLQVYKSATESTTFTFGNNGNINVPGTVNLGSALSISSGGTGATSAASALANLGAASSTLIGGQMKTFTIAGDKEHYYPVVFNVSSEYFVNRIAITRSYRDTAPDDWGTDINHKGGLTFQFQWNGDSTWGGNGNSTSLKVETLIETFCKMVGGMKLSTSGVVVWLRGGSALYKVLNEMGSAISITPYYDTFTDDDGKSFPVRTYDASVVDSEIQQRLVFYPLTGGNLLGKLYASEEISGTQLYSKTNNYPEVHFKNAAGTTLAEFYVDTTSGGFADTVLKVSSDASTAKYFVFGTSGIFGIPNGFSTEMGEFKNNAYPQLFFRNGNGNNLAQLVVPTNNGSYSGLAVNVYSDVSNHVEYKFNSDGTFTAPAGITTTGKYISIKNNSYPQLIFSNANGADLGKVFVSTTDGSYAATKIRAYASASAYYDFQFLSDGTFVAKDLQVTGGLAYLTNFNDSYGILGLGNTTYGDFTEISCEDDGSLSINNALHATMLQVDGSNNWPSLYFKCSSKTNPGVLLQASATHGFGIYCYGTDLDNASTRYYEGYRFPDPATGLTENKNYTVYSEKNIIYSSSQPTGVKGAIWLKPV